VIESTLKKEENTDDDDNEAKEKREENYEIKKFFFEKNLTKEQLENNKQPTLAQIIEALNKEKLSLTLHNPLSATSSSDSSSSSNPNNKDQALTTPYVGSYAPPFQLGVRLAPKSNPLVIGDHIIAHVDVDSLADKAGVKVNSKIIQLNETDCRDKTHEFTLFYLNYLLRKNSCQSIEMTLAEPISISNSNSNSSHSVTSCSNLKSIINEILLLSNLNKKPTVVGEETNLNTSNDNSIYSDFGMEDSTFSLSMSVKENVNQYLKKIFIEASKRHAATTNVSSDVVRQQLPLPPQVIHLPYQEPKETLSLTSSNLMTTHDIEEDDNEKNDSSSSMNNLRDIIKEISITNTNGFGTTDATTTFQYQTHVSSTTSSSSSVTLLNNQSLISSLPLPPSPSSTTTGTTLNQEPHHILIQMNPLKHQYETAETESQIQNYTNTFEREPRGENQLYEVELLESDVDYEIKGSLF
jgi:hypothetical protein